MSAPLPSSEPTPRQVRTIQRSRVLAEPHGLVRRKVISRPCSNPACDKLQSRVAIDGGNPGPIEWICGYCGRIDQEPCPPSKRELEVVRLICDGKTTKEIAVALDISAKTAETHRSNVMRKLQINCVALLVRWALKHNLIDRWNPPIATGA